MRDFATGLTAVRADITLLLCCVSVGKQRGAFEGEGAYSTCWADTQVHSTSCTQFFPPPSHLTSPTPLNPFHLTAQLPWLNTTTLATLTALQCALSRWQKTLMYLKSVLFFFKSFTICIRVEDTSHVSFSWHTLILLISSVSTTYSSWSYHWTSCGLRKFIVDRHLNSCRRMSN